MYNMTGIAKFYNKFLSFIELDPTRLDPLIFVNFLTRPDLTRPDPRVGPTREQI